jgi:hypothetical protein
MSDVKAENQILIVGAGPSGLALAGELKRRGVDAMIIDQQPSGVNTSRACVVHARTMEVLEPLGVTRDLLAEGIRVPIFRIRDRDRPLLTIDFSEIPSVYRFTLMIPQNRVEEILLQHLEGLSRSVVRPCKLVHYAASPSSVKAQIQANDSIQSIKAHWLIGCDGITARCERSPVSPFRAGNTTQASFWPKRKVSRPNPPGSLSRGGLNKDPRRPIAPVVAKPARHGSVAVGGQRNRPALLGDSNRAGADQLVALLGPDTIAAGENPYRPDVPVARPAHQGGIAVGGERNRCTLLGDSNPAGADQLVALLGPDTIGAGENPYRPGVPGIATPAHQGGVAVGGERNREALLGVSNRAGADQLVALLGPDTIATGENPYRPGERLVATPAHQGGIAVGGKRNREALLGSSNRAGADQLVPLLGPDTIAAGENPY